MVILQKLEELIKKRETLFLFVLFLFSFVVRLIYLIYIRGEANVYLGDEYCFGQVAYNLLQGKGFVLEGNFYPSRLPLNTLVAYLFIKVFGYSIFKIHILSTFLASFVAPAVYKLADKIAGSKFVALLSAVYAAVYPFFVHEASFLDTENIFIPVFLIYLVYLIKIIYEKGVATVKNYLISGFLLGILLLTRGTLSMFLPFLTLFLLLIKWPLRQVVFFLALKIIVIAVVVAPWSYYLSKGVGEFAIFTKGTNAALLGSTNEIVLNDKKLAGSWVNLERDYPEELLRIESELVSRGIVNASEATKVLMIATDNLAKMPWLMLNKAKGLWSWSPKHPDNRNFRDDLVGIFSYGWLLPFFIILLLEKKAPYVALFFLLAFYFTVMTFITSGTMRFRLPLDPIIFIYVFNYFYLIFFKEKFLKKGNKVR